MTTDDGDARMLLVWEAWAKNEGNDGAADLFRRCAQRLTVSATPLAQAVIDADGNRWDGGKHHVAFGKARWDAVVALARESLGGAA